MTAQAAVLVTAIGFAGGLCAAAALQLWRHGPGRRELRWQHSAERRERLQPCIERLLRAAIRLDRVISAWSPTWRPVLSEERRRHALDLAEALEEEVEIAEVALRLDGASAAARGLRELKAQIDRFRVAMGRAPARTAEELGEVGAVAAAITASFPDLKAILLAELHAAPSAALHRHTAPTIAVPARRGWLESLRPLRHTVFRWLWLAALAAQLGTWTQNVGAVELMAILAPTALLLALVQTATSLPGLVLALPAGALADLVDRRRLLAIASGWMCLVALALGLLTFAHMAEWWLLLGLTFALGVGSVAALPAWQAIIPDLVPTSELAPAVTLSSVAINLARALGPAIGGVAVGYAGPGAAFALTGAALAFTTLVVLSWRPEGPGSLPSEGVAAAVWSGIRYSARAWPVRTILVRAAGFILFASALWALLPLISRQLGDGPSGYSGLLGALGVGALAGALLLGSIRRVLRPDAVLVAACALFAAASVGATFTRSYPVVVVLMLGAGMAWVAAISTFNVSAQRAAPRWVRGRVLASYQVAYMGSMAVGSAAWGAVASRLGWATTMEIAAALVATSMTLTLRWRLNAADDAGPHPAGIAIPRPVPALVGAQAPVPISRPRPARTAVFQARPATVLPLAPAIARRNGAPDLVGRQLGIYRIEALVGEGAYSQVFRARHVALDAPRAIKVLKPSAARDLQLREGFLAGARTAARLHHPSIVTVFDCDIEHDVEYVVMELVESMTLAERLEAMPVDHRLADPMIRRCVRDVASALDHAHANGIVHRDLKPANVLIRARDDRAMLSDFAVAPSLLAWDNDGQDRGIRAYAYLSPEQRQGAPDLTAASDVYAFTAMLYEIATGGPPLAPVLAAIAGHPDRPLPPLQMTAPHLPSGLDGVLSRGLAPMPQARHGTAGEVAEEYLQVTEPLVPVRPHTNGATVTSAAYRPTPPRRRGWMAAPVAALVCSAAVSGVYVAELKPVAAPHRAPAQGVPAPVRGIVDEPMTVGAARMTVLSAILDAPPPARLRLGPGERFLVVQVQYQSQGRTPTIVSPYDWVVTDEAGGVHGAIVDGVGGALPEGVLPPGTSAHGMVGFIVPSSARSLLLHYDAQTGEASAEVSLT